MVLNLGRVIIRRLSTVSSYHPKICIVGSGPAGFYTARRILKSHPTAHIDIYEKLPVPFGLVRFGVAPDHPEVKNCINSFTQAAEGDRLSFFGNVSVGTDVSISQLHNAYNAIVLAYGACVDRKLNIPGEFLPNVTSARRFVGWYNGLPADSEININFDSDDAVIIGQGNVALDVARILLTPIDKLKKTDIPEAVLEQLTKSRIKKVTMIGRRNAEHVAFTTKELREMVNLNGCKPVLIPEDFNHLRSILAEMPRKRRRLSEVMVKAVFTPTDTQKDNWLKATKTLQLKFQSSPSGIEPNSDGTGISGIRLVKNRMESGRAIATENTEFLPCNLIIKSIGYTSLCIDPDIPFDDQKGIVPNDCGRVHGVKGLYVCGWLGTGSVGIIVDTLINGNDVGSAVVMDLESDNDITQKKGSDQIVSILQEKGVASVSFNEWSTLNAHEVSEGSKLDKPREKITDVHEMLNLSKESKS